MHQGRHVTEERKASYSGQVYRNAWEITATTLSGLSLVGQAAIAIGYALSGGLKLVPQFLIGAAGFGGSPTAEASTRGQSFGDSAEDAVKTLSAVAVALAQWASRG